MSVDIGRKNRKSINLSSNALELSGNIKDNAQNNFDNLTRSVDHPPVHRSMIKLETKKNNENDKLTNSISNNKDKFFESNDSVHNNSKNITNDDKIFYTQTNSKCKLFFIRCTSSKRFIIFYIILIIISLLTLIYSIIDIFYSMSKIPLLIAEVILCILMLFEICISMFTKVIIY